MRSAILKGELTCSHARVDVQLDDEMINAIDSTADEPNSNERYADAQIMDHRNIHSVNDLHNPNQRNTSFRFSEETLA